MTITASNPFKADILSANLQLIGMDGASGPVNLTFFPSSFASFGRSFAMRGLFKMPSSKTDLASAGTEYVEASSLIPFVDIVLGRDILLSTHFEAVHHVTYIQLTIQKLSGLALVRHSFLISNCRTIKTLCLVLVRWCATHLPHRFVVGYVPHVRFDSNESSLGSRADD